MKLGLNVVKFFPAGVYGVLKAMKGGRSMTLKELVESSGNGTLLDELQALRREAAIKKLPRAKKLELTEENCDA